ncbi:MAG: hypothetical protein U0R81_15010 [Mycobacterium sp.]
MDAALGVLKANPDVIAAVGISVGGAVTQLLSDTALWQAVEGSVAGLITDLLGDTTVQGALNARISSLVSTLLGGGALGAPWAGRWRTPSLDCSPIPSSPTLWALSSGPC